MTLKLNPFWKNVIKVLGTTECKDYQGLTNSYTEVTSKILYTEKLEAEIHFH